MFLLCLDLAINMFRSPRKGLHEKQTKMKVILYRGKYLSHIDIQSPKNKLCSLYYLIYYGHYFLFMFHQKITAYQFGMTVTDEDM